MALVIANQLEHFNDDIKQLSETLVQMEEICKRTFEELDSLTGMWEGSANQSFRDQFIADSENMDHLHSYLHKFLEELGRDYIRYTKCESDIYEIIQNIEI